MTQIGNATEYALHCLLWLAAARGDKPSSRDLAALQGVPPAYLAKIFPKLEKAGLVKASEGIRGGYQLARPADEITVLAVVDAVEGQKPIFECQGIRERCALFDGAAPAWAIAGTCGIHAVMIRAERAMRMELARSTLTDLALGAAKRMPASFPDDVQGWFADRKASRTQAQIASLRRRNDPSP